MERVAVLRDESGFKVFAHVSGNQIDILHCPFCGSGAVIGRSDGTVECGFCTSVYTVQVQPQYNGFPQSVDGQPYQWPGMPEQPGVPGDPNAMGGAPMGPDGMPMDPNDPNADPNMLTNGGESPAPTDGGIGNLPPGGPPGVAAAPAEGDEEAPEGDDGEEDDGKPAFLKGKGDSKSKKKSYLTAQGVALDLDNYLAHLAINNAKNKSQVATMVKAARRAF